MQVFHCGGAEDDEEAHPERGALKRNRFVIFAFFLFILVGFENDGIQKQCEQAQDQDQFNAENKKISLQLGVNYLDITPISREPDPALIAGDGLHPSGKQYYRWAQLLAPMMQQVLP